MSDEKSVVPSGTNTIPQQSRRITRAEAIETALDPTMQVDMIIEAGQQLDRLTAYALSLTDSSHWDNMNGKPRLNKVGAHRIAQKLGLKVRTFGSRLVEEGKDQGGAFFVYQCTGEISHPLSPSVISCQGTCDSRNKFHTTRYEDVKDVNGKAVWEEKEYYDKRQGRKVKKRMPKRERIELQAHQVQKSFIAQQAQTLCKVKGITEYLGLERLEWRDIERATQARQEETTSVDFKDNSDQEKKKKRQRRKREQAPAAPPSRPEDALANGQQRSLVWKAYLEAMQWEASDLPRDASSRFYDWVASVVGSANRDKSQWTVGHVDKLLAVAEVLAKGEEPPLPSDADAPPPVE